MPIGAPGPTVDPEFSQLHGIGVGFSAGLKGPAAPAEDRNPFLLLSFEDNDGRPRHPLSAADFFRFAFDPVAAVVLDVHCRWDKVKRIKPSVKS
jgi:hypothetical protein